MRFHLDHTPQKPDFRIHHGHKIFLLGSCFSESIGNLLKQQEFETHSNPNGILFNPLSMHNCLKGWMQSTGFDERYVLEREGIFLSYLHHSSVHQSDRKGLIAKINSANQQAVEFLKEADYLILSFGTAFVYRHLELDATMANCHKQPAIAFEKRLVTPEEITGAYSRLIEELGRFNPQLRIIFTISPVKYLKDGLTENTLSKSTLVLGIHALVKKHPACFYFPAYELVTDDLRDYRFYKKDLAHPNELAIDYVWQKFSDCFFSEATQHLNQQIHKLHQALGHRRLLDSSEEDHKLGEFITKQKKLVSELKSLEHGFR